MKGPRGSCPSGNARTVLQRTIRYRQIPQAPDVLADLAR